MPELPEVETVARGLDRHMTGRRILRVEKNRPDLRTMMPADLVARLEGRRVEAVRRRAKYILVDLDDGAVVLAHLGMSGRITIAPPGQAPNRPDPHDHVVLHLDDGTVLRFNDARRFGRIDLARRDTLDAHPLLAGIGPEPLGPDFDGPRLAAALAGRRSPIKAALLDQRVVAGIGNIYACEALHLARLSPQRLAMTVTGARADRLAAAIRDVLQRAIAAGGSSIRDYVQTSGELGYFQHDWTVYGREGEPCRRCGDAVAVRRLVQSGRSTFYCARCQR
ncbi:bifunctional DNA-formamidopyrimidine glycosylase/DNA-(apurinic or apyrimidinic site) lyase [Stella sp.]|uniref:bifunctional DNA-formamidopyrimidine glycosylase/DNA-(apurinic or apyrimidinic site) lyase n=1 Tax=Stella sp. TaxID=2912054 RepID=UPI0035B48916